MKSPYDAAKTDFKDKSICACISTNTLEHIPRESIINIFTELYRILKDDGIISARIDYSDHYAHTDDNISLLNYLKYDDRAWKIQPQVPLPKIVDCYYYIEIFRKCGFSVIKEELEYLAVDIPEELIKQFHHDDDKWKATSAHILLRKSL